MPSIKMESIAPRFIVADVVRAAEWYRDTLGFEIQDYFYDHEHDADGNDILDADGKLTQGAAAFVHVRHGEAVVLQLSLGEAGGRPGGGAYIWLKGVDELFARCQAHGAEIVYPLETMPYGIKEFAVRDPDGFQISLGEFL